MLLQTGIRTECVNGTQQNVGWFEEYPSTPNVEKDFFGFSVSPGDSVRASVNQTTSGAWETRVDNLTTGLSGVMITGQGWGILTDPCDGSLSLEGPTTDLTYSGGYTVEWIVEDYNKNGWRIPLANFGAVAFSNLQTSQSPWTLTPSESVSMVQNGTTVATPSAPASDGFTVSYAG
jgi:hypothetical protein